MIDLKQPDIEDLEALIQQALAHPDEIRRSNRDDRVLLFYSSQRKALGYKIVRLLNGDTF